MHVIINWLHYILIYSCFRFLPYYRRKSLPWPYKAMQEIIDPKVFFFFFFLPTFDIICRPQSCNISFDVIVNRNSLRRFFFIMNGQYVSNVNWYCIVVVYICEAYKEQRVYTYLKYLLIYLRKFIAMSLK